jgi:hypothetical protein
MDASGQAIIDKNICFVNLIRLIFRTLFFSDTLLNFNDTQI